jgi:hypothetical protein
MAFVLLTVVLASGAAESDVMEIVAYLPRGLSDGYTKAEADNRYMSASATTLPSQTDNSGKFLTTDGTDASWATINVSPTPANVSDQANASTGYFDLPAGTTAQRPGSPASGMVRFNTDDGNPEWYDPVGSQWLKFSQDASYSVEYLVVAGGGGGGADYRGGGGGAGGYRSSVSEEPSGGGNGAESPVVVALGSTFSVIVGSGGPGQTQATGTNGNPSQFGDVASTGGGAGGGGWNNMSPGNSGGSGGGGMGGTPTGGGGGPATSGQGFAGGLGAAEPVQCGGGGGGASQAGFAGGTAGTAGDGGAGVSSSITGSPVPRAGGGGGGNYVSGNVTVGGAGGGGAGGSGENPYQNGVAGSPFTGGGGGGASGGASSNPASLGGNGGSGVVIIRYLGSQRGTGGTVTFASGYTIHTFTSSGSYTA